jgi:hypothetical protein
LPYKANNALILFFFHFQVILSVACKKGPTAFFAAFLREIKATRQNALRIVPEAQFPSIAFLSSGRAAAFILTK